MAKGAVAHNLMRLIILIVLLSISLPILFQSGQYGNFEYNWITLFVGISIGISIIACYTLHFDSNREKIAYRELSKEG